MAHRRERCCLKRHSSEIGSTEPDNVTNPLLEQVTSYRSLPRERLFELQVAGLRLASIPGGTHISLNGVVASIWIAAPKV
jgi:hypothetical protein